MESVAAELAAATARLHEFELQERPLWITKKLVNETFGEYNGILEGAPLDTKVAWVRDLFERVDVDSRELNAVAVWNATTAPGVNRSDAVSEWLRRAGPSRLLNKRGYLMSMLEVPRPCRSRAWLEDATLECRRCRLVVGRRSPVQRYCPDCAAILARERSRIIVKRRRHQAHDQ